jgi:hypothetical protein
MKRGNEVPEIVRATVAPETRDAFAELYVAGVLADAGWNVYFPRRDQGFDFIIAKPVGGSMLLRPVQVKGKYPTADKTAKASYGYVGKLSQLHPEMVLAIPFFARETEPAPLFTAYLPVAQIRPLGTKLGLFRASPAVFRDGGPQIRPHYRRFFDTEGLALLESPTWSSEAPRPTP